jgi:hypothetical protein
MMITTITMITSSVSVVGLAARSGPALLGIPAAKEFLPVTLQPTLDGMLSSIANNSAGCKTSAQEAHNNGKSYMSVCTQYILGTNAQNRPWAFPVR